MEARLKQEKTIIPKKKDGSFDTEKMKVMGAESFLRSLLDHSEGYSGKSPERNRSRSEIDE